MSTVGSRLKYYRKVNKLQQIDVSRKLGIHKSTILRYERSTTINQDVNICNEICRVIGIDPKLVYDDYMAFIACDYGEFIRGFRKKHKITHEKFGTFLGMHAKVSLKWEMGESEPSRASYLKLKELFALYGEVI